MTISATEKAPETYASLKKEGQPIGHTDCLVAGIALVNRFQLVTNNVEHFKRIKELELVNWST